MLLERGDLAQGAIRGHPQSGAVGAGTTIERAESYPLDLIECFIGSDHKCPDFA